MCSGPWRRARESGGTAPDRAVFEERFDRHFPVLFRLFHDLYGARPDWLDQLTDLVMQSARSWAERPAELKGLDAEREHNSGWFQSNPMLGGVCYVDRYAGTWRASATGSPTSRNSA